MDCYSCSRQGSHTMALGDGVITSSAIPAIPCNLLKVDLANPVNIRCVAPLHQRYTLRLKDKLCNSNRSVFKNISCFHCYNSSLIMQFLS